MRRKKKTIECIEYLSVSAPLDKVDLLEDKQSREAMDIAMIMQLNLLPVARKMVLEELEMKQNG